MPIRSWWGLDVGTWQGFSRSAPPSRCFDEGDNELMYAQVASLFFEVDAFWKREEGACACDLDSTCETSGDRPFSSNGCSVRGETVTDSIP